MHTWCDGGATLGFRWCLQSTGTENILSSLFHRPVGKTHLVYEPGEGAARALGIRLWTVIATYRGRGSSRDSRRGAAVETAGRRPPGGRRGRRQHPPLPTAVGAAPEEKWRRRRRWGRPRKDARRGHRPRRAPRGDRKRNHCAPRGQVREEVRPRGMAVITRAQETLSARARQGGRPPGKGPTGRNGQLPPTTRSKCAAVASPSVPRVSWWCAGRRDQRRQALPHPPRPQQKASRVVPPCCGRPRERPRTRSTQPPSIGRPPRHTPSRPVPSQQSAGTASAAAHALSITNGAPPAA